MRQKFKPDELVVCVESFGSSDMEHGGCARGVILRGSDPTVIRRPQFFIATDNIDNEVALRNARAELYAATGGEFQ
jgi:hypothetical protein